MNIFLDDIRTPSMSHNSDRGLGDDFSDSKNWIIVRDYFEFVDVVNKHINDIELVSFDHDLANYDSGKEWTGKDAADFLIKKCLDNDIKFPSWYVHSDNTSGRNNIISVILNYLRVIENLDVSKFRYYNKGIYKGKFI
jgi:hypothetical protein